MWNFIKVEYRRTFLSHNFYVGILGVAFSYFYSIYKVSGISNSVYNTYTVAVYFIPFVLSLTFCALPYAQSLCEDMENKYIQQIMLRVKIEKYVFIRMGFIAMSAVVTMILGTLIFVLCIRQSVPWIEIYDGLDTDFLLQICQGHYIFYFVIKAFFNGILAACLSVTAAFFSIYWQSKFFILAFPFLGYSASVYFSDVMFKNIPQADISQCFNPSYNIWNSKILSILYPICFTVIFISIIIFLTSNILRRRYYENVRK